MKYVVRGVATVSCWTEVEADSEAEAISIAEQRDLAQMTIQALYPEADESFHFESDGTPYNLDIEQ